jgi:hypothetical protein
MKCAHAALCALALAAASAASAAATSAPNNRTVSLVRLGDARPLSDDSLRRVEAATTTARRALDGRGGGSRDLVAGDGSVLVPIFIKLHKVGSEFTKQLIKQVRRVCV